MRVANIKYNDIANGPGVRTSLFVSGCSHHCFNCFNPETWSFKYGEEYTPEIEEKIINSLKPDYIEGLTLLGGDPFELVNQEGLIPLIRRIKNELPSKTIWCFTGYLYEELLPTGKMNSTYTDELLSYIDVLIDGEYLDAQKDITLIFKGSRNQRTIDVQASLKEGRVIELELDRGRL